MIVAEIAPKGNGFIFAVPGAGLEPTRFFTSGDFKSPVSTIPPPGQKIRRSRPESDRRIAVLQTAALTTSPLDQLVFEVLVFSVFGEFLNTLTIALPDINSEIDQGNAAHCTTLGEE
jgi:hypothetical protein